MDITDKLEDIVTKHTKILFQISNLYQNKKELEKKFTREVQLLYKKYYLIRPVVEHEQNIPINTRAFLDKQDAVDKYNELKRHHRNIELLEIPTSEGVVIDYFM